MDGVAHLLGLLTRVEADMSCGPGSDSRRTMAHKPFRTILVPKQRRLKAAFDP
jgi:hypothetical protein